MANTLRTEVEHVARQANVQKALQQAGGDVDVIDNRLKSADRVWLSIYSIALAAVLSLRYFFYSQYSQSRHSLLINRTVLITIAVFGVLTVSKVVEIVFISQLKSRVSKFNLRRIKKLMVTLLVLILIASILFQNWYTAFVSLGLISLVLGFALQTPITSLIAWIYILLRTPYRVGDRIKIGDATGDVIDVSYIDTTLWEFGGDLLSSDHPSGRVIKFPNSRVLNSEVYNYTWPLFPYIWNEIKFSIAYESDLEFVSTTMERVAEEEVGQHMAKQVHLFRELLAHTPVDQLEVREHPAVFFRTNANTWLDATVRYLVNPKEAGRVKSRLIKRLLEELMAEPERVLFPKSNAR